MMFNRSSIAALSAAMMLTLSACSGGAQVNAESSASTSASAESASAEASVTPTPSPTPTGYEPVLIRANVDLDNRRRKQQMRPSRPHTMRWNSTDAFGMLGGTGISNTPAMRSWSDTCIKTS